MEIVPWNEQRENIFLDRYALRDQKGDLYEKTPEDMWNRIARTIGEDGVERRMFKAILEDFKFVPSGRILAGGKTFYNCFVLGLEEDSRIGIMDTISDMIEVTSRGGGVGVNWSILRPRSAYIKGVNGKSSGSVAWMRGADSLADAIRQGGSRTAALMFIIDVWHPDVIEMTRSGNRFTRANFSINVSDEFMRAVQDDQEWDLIFPDTASPFYDAEWDGDIKKWRDKGLPVITYETVNAYDLWKAMTESAWMTGSPGMAFLERCNAWSNTWYLDRLTSYNPCAEQPLPVNGSCNLGSINLAAFIEAETYTIKWNELALAIKYAVRFLDRVIDVSEDINQQIGDYQRHVRRIGLGTMGLADVLILSKIRYGSAESCKFIDVLFSFIRDCAYMASVELAEAKGPAPGYSKSKYLSGKFIKTLPSGIREAIRKHGIRNLAVLTQPPTGTTSILAGASSGIEPLFSKAFMRKDATGEHIMKHPLFEGERKEYHVTAADVTMEEHVKVQAAMQKYVDSAISKTINMPHECTPIDISEAYIAAYASGGKGITIYRAGSLDDVLTPYCETCNI